MSRALEGLDGVSSAVVREDDDTQFDVTYDPAKVTVDAMLTAVSGAGDFTGSLVSR